MSAPKLNTQHCEQTSRCLDACLNNEASSDVRQHVESCEVCARELAEATRMRVALRRAVLSQPAPEELRQSVQRRLRTIQPGVFPVSIRLQWLVAAAAVMVVILGSLATEHWIKVLHGRRLVDSVLALGVSDHLQCAIRGHNYPEVANPPEVLRKKLGPQYAGLLEVVERNLPGFQVLEAHICSLPGSPRKYVHFITRGRGTILSVILTRSEGERLPTGSKFRTGAADGVNLYLAHVDGMNAAGFQSKEYWGFVVSDLARDTTMQIAGQLAPPLKEALDASLPTEARMNSHRPQPAG